MGLKKGFRNLSKCISVSKPINAILGHFHLNKYSVSFHRLSNLNPH